MGYKYKDEICLKYSKYTALIKLNVKYSVLNYVI